VMFAFFLFAVGYSSPVCVRTGALRGQGGAAEAADVELLPAGRQAGRLTGRSTPSRLLSSPGEVLHSALPLLIRQHVGIPSKYDES
jgi:hypothetical protein